MIYNLLTLSLQLKECAILPPCILRLIFSIKNADTVLRLMIMMMRERMIKGTKQKVGSQRASYYFLLSSIICGCKYRVVIVGCHSVTSDRGTGMGWGAPLTSELTDNGGGLSLQLIFDL